MNASIFRTAGRAQSPRALAPALLLTTLFVAPANAGVVIEWNHELVEAVRTSRTNPPVMTRNLALVNTAIWDAVVAIEGGYERYHVNTAPSSPADSAAAAAAAAHRVLSAVYPELAADFDALLDEHLTALAPGAARDAGVAWGREVADAILALRETDGWNVPRAYRPPQGDFWWVPTPAGFLPALLPQWPYVAPWTMLRGDQFRAPGPPATPSDPRYLRDYLEVKELGNTTSTTRTADQSEIAEFWNDGVGTSTPPGHWSLIAQQLAAERTLSLVDEARLFALLGITLADAAIVSWDSKYHYHHWRPVTAIVEAANDGSPYTQPDPEWRSYIATPPFPTYTSGHSTFSGSAGRMLALALGNDEIPFTTGSDGTPGALRSFDRLSEAAEEAGQSRIYGGIHWQYDNRDAIAGGRALAEYVFGNFLRPLPFGSEPCSPDARTLCLQDGRFTVTADWRSSAQGPAGAARVEPRTEASGELSFFSEDNIEVLVKVLDGCGSNSHWWVFTAGATNVEYVVRVADTETGAVRTYFNPLFTPGRATQDTVAFECL
jgi:hypothetical protein